MIFPVLVSIVQTEAMPRLRGQQCVLDVCLFCRNHSEEEMRQSTFRLWKWRSALLEPEVRGSIRACLSGESPRGLSVGEVL